MATVRRHWVPDDPVALDRVRAGRDDLVRERETEPGVFEQEAGPFRQYRRTVRPSDGGGLDETTTYRLQIPWFGWAFALLVRRSLARRPPPDSPPGRQPWWAPRDRLEPDQVLVLGLLAAASLTSAFVNTLFTQTVNFAADDFGIGNRGQGIAGTVVRCGIVLVAPLALIADRAGRRRIVVATAAAAPVLAALGALAPNFAVLTASQSVARPVGLALDLMIAVMAAEVMPRNSRAYAVSVTTMAAGLGAGVCVMSLRLADLGESAWRLVYLIAIVWLLVAFDLARRLPETRRFEVHHRHAAASPSPSARRTHRGRLAVQGAVAFTGNLFVAPASFFQNRYLDDVRGYTGGGIALFTVVTATPFGIGVLAGGRIADRTGRRVLGAVCVVVGTALVLISFGVPGAPMWISAMVGGIVLGGAVPALGVYRSEVFSTGNRSFSGYLVTAIALVGGSIGLLIAGSAIDHGFSHIRILGLLAIGQLAVAAIVLAFFPETAHRELEELNPEDAVDSADLSGR